MIRIWLLHNDFCGISKVNGDPALSYSLFAGASSELQTTTTLSGRALRVYLISTLRTSSNPVKISLAKLAVKANIPASVSCAIRRTEVVNLNVKLVLPGRQIAGVYSAVEDTASAAVDTWETLTLNFTPTENGVVEIEIHTYDGVGTTQSFYIDQLSATQSL